MIFLGIDTSCYTTSVAAVDENGNLVSNKRRLLSVAEGERGLRQSEAFFKHINNFPDLYKELLYDIDPKEITAVCVSTQPRGITSSYMPVFFAGRRLAETIAMSLNIPLFATDHQQGHIQAALYGIDMPKDKFCAVHLSGGTTEVLLINRTATEYKAKIIAATKDINAGQLIDRVGVMMGLDFPCGAALEELAKKFSGKFPRVKSVVRDTCGKISCNLSGVENIAKKMLDDKNSKESVAAYVFECVRNTLAEMAEMSIKKYGEMPILFAGGVMSNKLMRKRLTQNFEAYFAEPSFSADNAAGIALLCREKYLTLKK